MICFQRVDDRLIHGQVQTSWIALSRAQNVLVIDDKVRNDAMAIQILEFAIPKGMKLKVLNIDEGVAFWEKAIASKNRIMVLFKSIHTVRCLAEKGVAFESIMVGPSSYKEGSKEIIQSTYFSDEEIEDAKVLDALGVELFFQHTPEQKKIYWKEIGIK